MSVFFFFSSRRRHTRCLSDWSSDVCSSDLMWQGANRIQADVVDVDRDLDPQKRTLVADGHVVTNLWDAPHDDKNKDEKTRKPATPVLTEVHAGHMVYTEATRLTHYTGG